MGDHEHSAAPPVACHAAPLDRVEELRRRQRTMGLIRAAGVPFALVQVLTFYLPYPPGLFAAALALVGALAVVTPVVWVGSQQARTMRGVVAWSLTGLVLDTLVVLGFVVVHTFDPDTAVWAMLYLIPMEGAVLFQLRGALWAFVAVTAGYVVREVYGHLVLGLDLLPFSITFRMGIGLMMAVVFGVTAQRLVRERDRLHDLSATLHHRGEELRTANAALQAARRAQMDFVSVTNHELRTPLTAIRGFAVTLNHRWDDMPDHVRRAAVQSIEQQSLRLDELVADLLTVSSMRSGQLALTPRPLVLVEWLGQSAVIADVLATIRCNPDVMVQADSTRLLQILVNLLTNARKYGAPPFVIQASSDGTLTTIHVVDHGPGVPEAFVPRMFEEFTQASVGDTRTADGTGLGLAIVKYLVDALDGTVGYQPLQGGGSVFTITLPAGPGVQGGSAPPRASGHDGLDGLRVERTWSVGRRTV